MSTPKISVIVPVYKVEQYLHRCIDSILAQTFTDFELLLINDGSPDNCGVICDEYAAKDARVRVFHKENGGVSNARNLGLDNAIGEWIVFIDSDDTVDYDYLENLYTPIIHSNNSVLVFANYVTSKQILKPIINGKYEKSDMVRVFIEQGLMRLSAPYSKLFNTSIIKEEGIHFPSGVHMGEDAIFVLKYLNLVDKIIITNKCNYLVNRHEGSLITKYNSFESEWKGYTTWKKELLSFITKYGPIYEDPVNVVWENCIGNSFVRCLQCIYRTNELISFSRQISILKNIPQTDYDEYKKYFKTNLIRRKLNKFLVINKLYPLYCFLGLVERYIKKISL